MSSSPVSWKACSFAGVRSATIGERRLEVGVGERRMLREQAELAVPPHDRRLGDLEVDVARAKLNRAGKNRIQVHERADRQAHAAA